MKWQAYPKYRNSGIKWLGDIPEHWQADRLRWTVLGCKNGTWGKEPDGVDDITCIRVADFDRIKFRVIMARPTVRAIGLSERRQRLLQNRDLLLEKSGGGELHSVGTVVLYDHYEPAVCSNFIARMPVAQGFDPSFLTYLHAHLYSARVNIRSIKQTTGIQNLDSFSYLDEVTAYPLLDEQRAIAAFLDRETEYIDLLVEKKRRQIELLQEKRVVLISLAVTKGLNPNVKMKATGVEWIGEIPKHWDILPLFAPMRECDRRNKGNTEENVLSLSYGQIKRRDVSDNFGLLPESFETYQIVERENIILRLTDLQNDQVSLRVGLAKERGIITSAYVCLEAGRSLEATYVYYLLHTYDISKVFYAFGGGVRQSMKFADLKWLPIVVPEKLEQRAIADFLDRETARIDALVEKIRTSISLLREYRSALITAAVTGKIDVRRDRNGSRT